MALLAVFAIALDHKRDALLNLANYVISPDSGSGIAVGVMMSNGSFFGFLEATTASALATKGGAQVVLAAWLGGTIYTLTDSMFPIAVLIELLLIGGLSFARHRQQIEAGTTRLASRGMFFLSAALVGVLLCFTHEPLARAFASVDQLLGPEAVYAVVVLLFAGSLWSLTGRDRLGPENRTLQLQLVALTGLTVAIGFGSATSAALSRGEAALGLGTISGAALLLGRGRLGSFLNAFALSLRSSYVSASLRINSNTHTNGGAQRSRARMSPQKRSTYHFWPALESPTKPKWLSKVSPTLSPPIPKSGTTCSSFHTSRSFTS